MGLFLLVAVTGYLLNHGSRFGLDDPRTRTQAITLPTASLAQPDRSLVERELRRRLGSPGALNSFEVEPEELRITFKKPGLRTDAIVNRANGQTDVTVEDRGVLGVLTDLHKGASAGTPWSYMIDSAAVVLALVSLSGLVMLLSLPRRRWAGVIMTIIGAGAVIAAYALFVA